MHANGRSRTWYTKGRPLCVRICVCSCVCKLVRGVYAFRQRLLNTPRQQTHSPTAIPTLCRPLRPTPPRPPPGLPRSAQAVTSSLLPPFLWFPFPLPLPRLAPSLAAVVHLKLWRHSQPPPSLFPPSLSPVQLRCPPCTALCLVHPSFVPCGPLGCFLRDACAAYKPWRAG